MRVLITGARGFVAPYAVAALQESCDSSLEIVAMGKDAGTNAVSSPLPLLDVTDPVAVEAAIARHAPTHVLHLAGIAAPALANANPDVAWRVHVQGTLNLARAILSTAPNCWLMYVGSGLIYGESAKSGLPLDETTRLAPIDEYSATKAAADLALGALARRGLNCIRFRPFNHIGPGQTEGFVVPALAMQVARIELGLTAPIINVGNLDAERDFLDVRDVANAYARAICSTKDLEPGGIFNIASGAPQRIGDILEWLLERSRVNITIKQDPARLRPSDIPRIVGNASHARELLNWVPQYSFEESLLSVLNDCRVRAAQMLEG
jgi:GDP-4-dehydro-6-deoxy-D-mannose reductase